jgi:intracellular septation protein A
MKNLLSAARVLMLDLASTILFLAIYLSTDNLFLAVGLGMALGVAQIGWQGAHRQPIGSLQWLSVVLVLASGTATFVTHDPTFVMLKPSVIYVIVGLVMLKRGWMNRYLPARAAPVADVATSFGYVWAGLMFASAGLTSCSP